MNSDSGAQPPLPTLYEAQLDVAQVNDLFTDLEHAAQIHEVRIKHGGTARSKLGGADLPALTSLLWANISQSIQIIYTHKGSTWIDTLMRTPDGAKLVRMRHEFRPGAL